MAETAADRTGTHRARRQAVVKLLNPRLLHYSAAVRGYLAVDHGRVAEHGTHAELIRSGGAYQRLWEASR
jgi:hypothetical protein